MTQVSVTECVSIVCPTVLLHPEAKPPMRAEDGAAGHDICCVGGLEGLQEPDKWPEHIRQQWQLMGEAGFVDIRPQEGFLFRTGFAQQIDPGYFCVLRDRSGLGAMKSVHLFAGVIDPSYRGEWFVRLHNHNNCTVRISCGDKIVQGTYHRRILVDCPIVSELPPSGRGLAGFGSTDTKA